MVAALRDWRRGKKKKIGGTSKHPESGPGHQAQTPGRPPNKKACPRLSPSQSNSSSTFLVVVMAETGAGEPAAKRQRVEPKPKVILGCGKICWPLEINPTVMRERAIEGKAK
jgi:hypothetical protein